MVAATMAALVVVVIAFPALGGGHAGGRLDGAGRDWLIRQQDGRPAGRDVVIVEIGPQSDTQLAATWPYPRTYLARAIDRLAAAGASAIVLDVPLDGVAPEGVAADAELVRSIQRARHVALAASPDSGLPLMRSQVPGAAGGALAMSGAAVGSSELVRSADGVARWVRRSTRIGGDPSGASASVPPLAAAALQVAGEELPKVMPGRIEIDFAGAGTSRSERFARRPFDELLTGSDLSWADGAIVLIGRSGSAEGAQVPTPLARSGRAMLSPVEAHAQALVTIRNRSWLRDQWIGASVGTVLSLIALSLLALARMRTPAALCVVVLLELAWLWHACRLIASDSVVAPVAAIAGSVALAMGSAVMASLTVARRERRQVEAVFRGRIADRELARITPEDFGEAALGGRVELVAVSVGIRGLARWGVDEPSVQLEQLNECIDDVVGAILDAGGTVDRVAGTRITAFFGAPLAAGDDADRACDAAVEIVARAGELNEIRRRRNLPPLQVHVGIDAGEATVGVVGVGAGRAEYSAFGGAVDRAAALLRHAAHSGIAVVLGPGVVARVGHHGLCPLAPMTVNRGAGSVQVHSIAASGRQAA